MAGPLPPSPSKGPGGIGVEPFPPPSSTNNKQDHTKDTKDKHQTSLKLDFEDNSEVDTDANTAKDLKDTDVEDDSEMPKPRPQPIKREADISLILSPPQRVDMTKLNEGIHSKIEEQINKPFNFLHYPVAQVNRVKIWNYAPIVAAQMPPQTAHNTEAPCGGDVAANSAKHSGNGNVNDTRPGQEQGEAPEGKPQAPCFIPKIDANSVKPTAPSMSVLKDEAIQYFNKWKATFNKRFNDLVVPTQPSFNGGPSRQGQGAPRGGGAGPGPAGRNLQQVNKGTAYQADLYLIRRFQPVETTLCHLPVDKRRLLIHAMILMLLSTEHYISYSRLYLLYLASSLHIPSWVLTEEENRIAGGLGKIYKTLCEQAEEREVEEKKQAEELQKIEEAQKAAEARVTGVVSQLERSEQTNVVQEAQQAQEAQQVQEARPAKEPRKKWRPSVNPIQVGTTLLAEGIGMVESVQGLPAISLPPTTVTHLIGPLGDCETAIGVFFGVNPSRPSIQSIETLTSGLHDGAFIPLHCPAETEIRDSKDIAAEHRRMRLVLCVNGVLKDMDDIVTPWNCLGHHNEVLAVRWESECLEKIGGAFNTLVKSKAWPESLKQLCKVPITTVMALQAWPESLMRVNKIVDNAWVMGLSKCSKLQQVLSDTIVSHVLGERGISLIGYGLGARAIYLCLTHLAERKQYGLVDTVVLMGAPIPGDAGTWSALKAVVSGRLVNIYSPTDYMLAFASRQSAHQFGVAGLQQIQGVGGVENHDISDILNAHLDYPALVPAILKRIAWEDLKPDLKAPPPQPKVPASIAQKPPVATGKRPVPGVNQVQGKVGANENKENSLPQRGGKNSRGGGRGGGRGGRNNNVDKTLADQMGKMSL